MAADPRIESLRPLLGLSPVAIMATELETGLILALNERAEELFQITASESIGHTTTELNLWDAPMNRAMHFEKLAAGGGCADSEVQVRRKDGTIRDCLVSSRLLQDGIIPTVVVSTLQDVTQQRQQEAALHESEARYRVLTQGSSDVILQVVDRRIGYVSPSVKEVLGWDPDELVGTDPLDLVHPEDAPTVARTRDTLLRTGSADRPMYRLRTKAGSWVWMEASIQLLRDEQGNVVGTVSSAHNISERMEQEERLRKSEAMYRLIAENSLDIVTRHDLQGRYLWVSPSAEAVFGFTPGELSVSSAFEMIHPDDQSEVSQALAEILSSPITRKTVYRHRTKSGKWLWVESMARVLRDTETDAPVEIQVSTREISEQKAAEDRYRSLFDNLTTGFVLYEIVQDGKGAVVDFRFLEVNPAYEKLTGLAGEVVLGRTLLEVLPGVEAYWIEALGKVALTGEPLRFENYAGPLDKWYETWAYRPSLGQLAVLVTDVTERQMREQALRTSEANYRLLADNSTDMISRIDSEGRVAYVSPSVEGALGWPPQHFLRREATQGTHPDDVMGLEEAIGRASVTGEDLRPVYRTQHRNGQWVWVESSLNFLRDSDGKANGLIASSRDVTSRVLAEQSLKEREARLREVADMSLDMLSRHDLRGVCLWASPACRQILGIEPETVVGRWAFDFILEEDRPSVHAALAELFKHGKSRLQYRIRRTDRIVFWAESIWTLNRDENGEPHEIHCSTRDIREQHLQSLLLEETQRMARLGGWENNLDTGVQTWTREQSIIHERDPDLPPPSTEEIQALLEPDSIALLNEAVGKTFADGTPWDIILRGRTFKDRPLIVRSTGRAERDSDGRIHVLRGSSQDITQQELLREQFDSASHLNQSILSTTEALVVLLDLEGRIVKFNEACQRLTGWSEAEVLGRPLLEILIPPEDRGGVQTVLDDLSHGHGPNRFENQWITRKGERLWISWANSFLRSEDGKVRYLLGTGIDMTAYRATRRQLEESQERWRILIENAPEAIVILDMDESRFVLANPAAEALYGLPQAVLLTLGPVEVSPPHQPTGIPSSEAAKDYVRKAIEGRPITFEWTHVRPDGTEFLCLINLSRIPSEDRNLLRGSLVDITEKRKTESVFQALVRGTSSLVGQPFFDALTKDLADLLGVRIATIGRIHVDEDRIHYISVYMDGRRRTSFHGPFEGSLAEQYAMDPDGGILFVSDRLCDRYPSMGFLRDLDVESYMGIPLRTSNNETIGLLSVMDSKPMVDDELARFTLTMFADRARSELERFEANQALHELNAELETRVQKRTKELVAMNRELESFSYSVSHDLRSPLRSIDGFAQALSEDYGNLLDETGMEFLGRIRSASTRMAELIDDLLSLSQSSRRVLRLGDVDLSALATEILEGMRSDEPERRVEIQVEPGLRTHGDPVLLRAVLENLLGNSWKYTRRKENARICFHSAPAGSGLRGFSVDDNGAGFDMTFSQKLFGTFQRLHLADEFEGNGIGLATVKRILERHGGTIRGQGEIDVGATFVFELPE